MKKKWPFGNNTIAWLWGLLESICFFIVPDVFLSFLALYSYKKALLACLYSLAGALVGGLIMYTLSGFHADASLNFIDSIPGINTQLISTARELIQKSIWVGMIKGAFTGVPYKIFSAQAAITNVPVMVFLSASIPARLLRFVLISLISAIISEMLLKKTPRILKIKILALVWLIFYAFYFHYMGW